MSASDREDYEDHGYGEASRYAAHLDRGWALLEQGDTVSARTSADHAQQARPEDPDAAVLLGAIALAEGHADESLRFYERALELDPDYLEPYTAAAQVCLFDLDDPARALRYCDEALELEGLMPFERIDLELMAAECDLSRGSVDDARTRLDGLTLGPLMLALELGGADDAEDETEDGDDNLEIDLQTDRGIALAFLRTDAEGELLEDDEQVERVARAVQFALRLARLRIDVGQTARASELMGQLTERYPRDADAWYLLSEAAYRDGVPAVSSQAALRALELDGIGALPAWVPSPAMVHRRVVDILHTCPDPGLRALVEGSSPVAIVVRESAAPELVLEGVDPRLTALALASRAGSDPEDASATTLTGLVVYRRSVCRYSRDAEHFDQELSLSVLDELATFLALDDTRRDAVGLPPLPPGLRAAVLADAPGPAAAADETDDPKRRRSRRHRRA